MSVRFHGVVSAAALGVALAGALTACGGASKDATGPSPAASGTASASSPATASSATTVPTTAVSSSAPAGTLVQLEAGSVRVPADWRVRSDGPAWARQMCPPERLGAGCVMFTDLDDTTAMSPSALTHLVHSFSSGTGERWVRRADVTLGGLRFFHLVDEGGTSLHDEAFGTLYDDRDVILQFSLSTILMKPQQRRHAIDTISGSFRPS